MMITSQTNALMLAHVQLSASSRPKSARLFGTIVPGPRAGRVVPVALIRP